MTSIQCVSRATLLLLACWIHSAVPLAAQPERIDPRNPNHCALPELGRMIGTMKSRVGGWGESFGRGIHAIGDVNNDGLSDWIVERLRVDTFTHDKLSEELLLFHGVRGGLPLAASGERIGPDVIGAYTHFLAAGDWDGDGHRDIATRQFVFGDTSAGGAGYEVSSLVVYWGNRSGSFTNSDTSRLVCDAGMWLAIWSLDTPGDMDLNADGVHDLVVMTGSLGFSAGVRVPIPSIYVFLGNRRVRWGQGGASRIAAWRWWNPPVMNKLTVIDHDGDGLKDFALVHSTSFFPTRASASVVYGSPGILPDTTVFESVSLVSANGHHAQFMDLTGDNIPELVMATGSQEMLKVFVGMRGQRLREQYGSGYDPPRPGEKQWWGRPWAEVWLPFKMDDGWTMAGFKPIFNLGDIGRDGVPDVCMPSHPWIVCDNGGDLLDSMIDALIHVPRTLSRRRCIARRHRRQRCQHDRSRVR